MPSTRSQFASTKKTNKASAPAEQKKPATTSGCISASTSIVAVALVPRPQETLEQSWERLKSSCVASFVNKAFPPTLFLDAPHSNGILIPFMDDEPPKAYFRSYHRRLPILSQDESIAWTHKHAAHTAVSRRFPLEAARLVGTITFHFQETKKKSATIANGPFAYRKNFANKNLLRAPLSSYSKQCKRITRKQALDEAYHEQAQRLSLPPTIEERTEEIFHFWTNVVQPSKPTSEGWDPIHGGLECPGHDPSYVPLPALKAWITNNKNVKQVKCQPTRELYNGLCTIPVDAITVLNAIADLSCAEHLYQIPLIIPYPVVELVQSEDSNTSRANWRVTIGIYIHRMLPEVLTMQTLHVVMSALDPKSYRVTEPLHLPPMLHKNAAVFQSNPYPKVDWPLDRSISINIEEEKKEENIDISSKDEVIDLTATYGSTRDEPVISPFSVRGLLKLLESEGCDTSNWPTISNSVTSKLQLDLMLHQQHAICWMVQMENLGGFGINSILWEEREFFDGGKYYYSPALGQIRLGCPPHMKGGLLIDEMGLGKTVSTIGLILATLDELKQEAADHIVSTSTQQDDDILSFSHATLIIVPPSLIVQWQHEICKAAGQAINVSVLSTDTGLLVPHFQVRYTKRDRQLTTLSSSDILLTTYDALTHKRTARWLSDVRWGRIVLDEMQEIRSSTTQISHNCGRLICNRRWMLSGTPLFEGIDDLRGELNFLQLEPFAAALEDGFFQFSVKNLWDSGHPHAIETLRILGLVALRRAKDMIIRWNNQSILGLNPLTVEFIPVPQSPSERAIYCWLEYVVQTELKETVSMSQEKDRSSRTICLRLLREFCITPMLLNGGLGVQSQLNSLNLLMVQQNRRTENHEHHLVSAQHLSKKQKVERVMSCERAIRFLTQVQRSARLNENFVTDVMFSTGGALTRRDIAHESVETRYKEAKLKLQEALETRAASSKKRATLRWHLALELVTTGMAKSISDKVATKFSKLWNWRRLISLAKEQNYPRAIRQNQSSLYSRGCLLKADRQFDKHSGNHSVPAVLARGWRPSPIFLRRDLYRNNPHFLWAHPIALKVDCIPVQVTEEELQEAFYQASTRAHIAQKDHDKILQLLQKERSKLEMIDVNDGKTGQKPDFSKKSVQESIDMLLLKLKDAEEALCNARISDKEMKRPKVVREPASLKTGWSAVVQFDDELHAKFAFMSASKANGIPLSTNAKVPHIELQIQMAAEKVELLESENAVHPSKINLSSLLDARKDLNLARAGLRIVTEDKLPSGHAVLSKLVGPYRSLLPHCSIDMKKQITRSLADLGQTLDSTDLIISRQTQLVERLEPALKRNVKEEVAQMSAFETLDALRSGFLEKTQCPICLGSLGSEAVNSYQDRTSIAMINCGHLFCSDCLSQHVQEKLSNFHPTTCPNCRKQFSFAVDVIYVDHRLKDEEEFLAKERMIAKQTVREASRMLERSNGLLDAKMWRQLYLAFDVPSEISVSRNSLLPALPREILSHFRAATGGMEIHCGRGETPTKNSRKGAGLCSKVQALLADLPRTERSVVFSSSKECIRHLIEVLKSEAIGFRALFTGQSIECLRQAVSDWEEDLSVLPTVPVLLVQAGAAASGLTLTSASKMFIMEPFLRVEEEQQAYARLHRFGQKHAVQVRCYFHPVSVESRLLEWRKRCQVGESEQRQTSQIVVRRVEEMEMATESESDAVNLDALDDGANPDDTIQSLFLLGLIESEK